MDQNRIDNFSQSGNNKEDNDYYEIIKLDELEPLNDPNCKHYFVKDDSDVLGNSVAWKCSKCHRGTFLAKNQKIVND